MVGPAAAASAGGAACHQQQSALADRAGSYVLVRSGEPVCEHSASGIASTIPKHSLNTTCDAKMDFTPGFLEFLVKDGAPARI